MAATKLATARVSSKGQIAIPKSIRDQLGLREGMDLAIRLRGEEIILRKAPKQSWRRWRGKLKGSSLLKDRARERRKELAGDAKGV